MYHVTQSWHWKTKLPFSNLNTCVSFLHILSVFSQLCHDNCVFVCLLINWDVVDNNASFKTGGCKVVKVSIFKEKKRYLIKFFNNLDETWLIFQSRKYYCNFNINFQSKNYVNNLLIHSMLRSILIATHLNKSKNTDLHWNVCI